MADPLFGSASQLWPQTPVPTFGFFQSQVPPGPRLFNPGSSGMVAPIGTPYAGGIGANVSTPGPMQESYGQGSGMMLPAFAGPAFGAGLIPVLPATFGTMPPFAGSETAIGVTAPVLLMAVAIRRGQPLGPSNDQEIEDFIYDAFDLIPGANDVEVRCEAGRVTLTGSVPQKRLKRDVGEIAWAIPTLHDVQNSVTISARRRSRAAAREGEAQSAAGRKQG